jgi:hypothetical protein
MNLSSLRFSIQDELDLTWYYQEAHQVFGSIPCALNVASGSLASWEQSDRTHENMREVIKRYHRIRDRLRLVPMKHRRVLEAKLGATLTPEQTRRLEPFGHWAGAVALLSSRGKWTVTELYREASDTKRSGEVGKNARERIAQKIRVAELLYLAAIQAWNGTSNNLKEPQHPGL